ncbi:hypothetical protein LBMAG53_35560 [Planctomycetota bacterium]|nr:hypothetical protein LBMAG53_35560 [Planctomycetota bacterium]
MATMRYLSPDQLDRYRRDGFLVINDFLQPNQVRRVEAGIARACTERAGQTRDGGGFNLEKVDDDSMNHQAAAKRPGMFRKIQGAAFTIPEVGEVFTRGDLLDLMEDLIGPEIWYHSSKVMFKPANGGAAKPWHQDAAYWQAYDPRQITVWIAIHDADQGNGCVWAIPGSHRLGLVPHAGRELQVGEGDIDVAQAIPVPVAAGGLLIFHSLVLHMSQRNTSDRDRWSIICDYDCAPNPVFEDIPANRPVGMDEKNIWSLRRAQQTGAAR